MLKEFKKFALKGNVMDLAIGVIIGGAFGKIVTSIVDDLIMPLISLLTGGYDFTKLGIVLRKADEAKGITAVTLQYGAFLQSVINFLIIALCVFFMVKAMNNIVRKEEEKVSNKPAKPTQEELLTDIRDNLIELNKKK